MTQLVVMFWDGQRRLTLSSLSCVMRKPAFCICTDQRFCFCYIDSIIPLHVLPKSEISSLYPSSAAEQPGLYQTSAKARKPHFLAAQLSL